MLDRSIPPPFAKEFSFSLPQPDIIALANGVPIVWIRSLQQQVAKIEVVMQAGKWYEPKIGLAHFAISMLEKGADGFSADDIAETLDMYGAQLELGAGPDFASVSMYTLNNKLDKVLPVLLSILSKPTVPEDELALMKAIFIENLKVNNEKSSYLASKYFKRNVFGAQHPYGSSLEIENVDSNISVEGIRDFFSRRFQPFEIYITGSLSDNQIKQVTSAFSQFSAPQSSVETIASSESLELIRSFKKEGSVQTSLRIGNQTISRNHADYFQLLLLNHLFGGYFGSRLMKNIREEKGLTYGIYSSVTAHKNAAVFTIGTDVNLDKAALTLEEIQKELLKLQNEPIAKTELEVGRNHFLGSLQLELSNPFSVTEKIKNIRLNNLPSNYYQTLMAVLANSTPEMLQHVATKHLNWSFLHQVSVG